MVFLTGPSQVGKTWLALKIAEKIQNSQYLNYDSSEDRKIIKNEAWLDKTRLLIFDEFHKMKGWKNYLKGVYDTKPKEMMILVTGNARLKFMRQSRDSLAGRFFRYRFKAGTGSSALSRPQRSSKDGHKKVILGINQSVILSVQK